jgi:hypothetical protein
MARPESMRNANWSSWPKTRSVDGLRAPGPARREEPTMTTQEALARRLSELDARIAFGEFHLRERRAASRAPGANLFEVGLACRESRSIEDALAILRQRRIDLARDLAREAA